MTPADFRAARKRLKLTVSEMAEALGVGTRTINRYNWEGPIPKMAALAIEALESRAQNSPCVPD